MDTDFVNLYIEGLVNEIGELTKVKLLNDARMKYVDAANQKLIQRIEELEKLLEKQNKKKKEVDTSSENF